MRRYLCVIFSIIPILLISELLVLGRQVESDTHLVGVGGQSEQKPPNFDLEQYQFGMLRKGPAWTSVNSPEVEKIQAGHLENIGRMASLGKLVAAGPVVDNGDLRGIFIFKASLEEATRLAAEDPAIKTGRLALSLVGWMGPKGIGASYIAQHQRDPAATKTTMTKYHIALLKNGTGGASNTSTRQIQLDHLWNIRRMMDSGKLSAAGPFLNGGDLRGVFVFATQSIDEAREWAQSDPAVKAGLAAIELHPWLVAKEVWQQYN